jgi:hypothetical protein
MYKTRFAGTFPLAPTAKENRGKDSLLSYYPRTLRQGKASQFARRMRPMMVRDDHPYSSGGAAKPALSLSKGALRRARKRAPSPGEFPAAERRFAPCAAVLRRWPRNPCRRNTRSESASRGRQKGGLPRSAALALRGVCGDRGTRFSTTDSCPRQLSFRWKRFELPSRVD